jgi:acyl carrier protein
MDASKIQAVLQDVFHEVFDDPAIVITPTTTAHDIADWDSFNHVRLIVATEQRFNITLSTTEVADLRNVGELIALIGRHTNQN